MSNARENVNLLASADFDIAALRLANWGAGAVPPQVMLKQNWVAGDGGGLFRYDASDTTTADNGGTVIVDAAGNRWKRQWSGDVVFTWFGPGNTSWHPVTNATANHTALFQSAIAATKDGGVLFVPSGIWAVNLGDIVINKNLEIRGEGASFKYFADNDEGDEGIPAAPPGGGYYTLGGTWLHVRDGAAASARNWSNFSISSSQNDGGRIRLNIGAHDFTVHSKVKVSGTSGNCDGSWYLHAVGATWITLKNSTFVSALSGVGTLKRWRAMGELAAFTVDYENGLGLADYKRDVRFVDIGYHGNAGGNVSHPNDNIRYSGFLWRGAWMGETRNLKSLNSRGAVVWHEGINNPLGGVSDWRHYNAFLNAGQAPGALQSRITSYANNGSGGTRLVTAQAHGITNGQTIYMREPGHVSYEGSHVATVINTTTLDIPVAYTATTSGALLLAEHWNNWSGTCAIGGYAANDGVIESCHIAAAQYGFMLSGLANQIANNRVYLCDFVADLSGADGSLGAPVFNGCFFYDTYGPPLIVSVAPTYSEPLLIQNCVIGNAWHVNRWVTIDNTSAIWVAANNVKLDVEAVAFAGLQSYGPNIEFAYAVGIKTGVTGTRINGQIGTLHEAMAGLCNDLTALHDVPKAITLLNNGTFGVWEQAGTSGAPDRWDGVNVTTYARTTGIGKLRYGADVTFATTSTGYIRQRIRSEDIRAFVGQPVAISFYVQNLAGSGDFKVELYYANALNNFGAVTAIGDTNLGTTPATATFYQLRFPVLPSGAANGIELRFVRTSSAVAPRIVLSDVAVNEGPWAKPIQWPAVSDEKRRARQFYRRIIPLNAAAPIGSSITNSSTTATAIVQHDWSDMVITPSLTINGSWQMGIPNSSQAVTVVDGFLYQGGVLINLSGTGLTSSAGFFTSNSADASIVLDARP
jgi:hypothetical protein